MAKQLDPVNEFTVGEVSKLYGIPESALRYYDKIGLFKPISVNQATGYRYYATEQFELLNIIQYLKYLGMPLKEMKQHFEKRDEQYFLQLLIHCKSVNENKINELAVIQHRFNQRIEELQTSLNITDVGVARIETLPQRNILCVREQIRTRPEMELSLKRLEQITRVKASLFIGRVGVSIAQQSLLERDFSKYSAISIFPEEIIDSEQSLVTLTAGEYACIYCRSTLFDSDQYYGQLLDYIDEKGYSIAGDSVERIIIDQFITNNSQKHLSAIQIPVKR